MDSWSEEVRDFGRKNFKRNKSTAESCEIEEEYENVCTKKRMS